MNQNQVKLVFRMWGEGVSQVVMASGWGRKKYVVNGEREEISIETQRKRNRGKKKIERERDKKTREIDNGNYFLREKVEGNEEK